MRDESQVTQVENMLSEILVLDRSSSCKCLEAKATCRFKFSDKNTRK